ncbi:MAG: polyprenyl synthetase family protein [Dehalococcoidales bacterium]
MSAVKLSQIYEPVQEDLLEVEKDFQRLVESKRDTFPELHQMLEHALVGGKVVRPALCLLAGRCYKYDRERLLPMAASSELLHIATLVHDDAIDKADTRRGRATINKLWGLEKAVLLGDHLFARAGEFAAATENITVVRLFAQTLQIISSGELKQAASAFKLQQTFDQYLERIAGKTAALMVMATQSGAILGQAPPEGVHILRDYGYNMGLAFQMVDDILDFIGDKAEMGKPVGSDLAQGTITLPSLLLLERYPDDNPIEKIFGNQDREQNLGRAIDMVLNSGIIEECYKIAADYSAKACRDLDKLPGERGRRSLAALADYIIERRK